MIEIATPIMTTALIAITSWYLPNFYWRLLAVFVGAFLSSSFIALFSISENIYWQGLITSSAIKFSLMAGLYIIFIIQIIIWIKKRINGLNQQ